MLHSGACGTKLLVAEGKLDLLICLFFISNFWFKP